MPWRWRLSHPRPVNKVFGLALPYYFLPHIYGQNISGAIVYFGDANIALYRRASHAIITVHPMAHGRLQWCLKLAKCHARRLHHSSGSPCLTVAKLLDSPPSDGNVTVKGYIRSIRNQKARSFAVIGDGTSLEPLQAVLLPDQAQRYVRSIGPGIVIDLSHSLSTGCAVSLTGSWRVSPNAKKQAHELHVEDVRVLGTADPAAS